AQFSRRTASCLEQAKGGLKSSPAMVRYKLADCLTDGSVVGGGAGRSGSEMFSNIVAEFEQMHYKANCNKNEPSQAQHESYPSINNNINNNSNIATVATTTMIGCEIEDASYTIDEIVDRVCNPNKYNSSRLFRPNTS